MSAGACTGQKKVSDDLELALKNVVLGVTQELCAALCG